MLVAVLLPHPRRLSLRQGPLNLPRQHLPEPVAKHLHRRKRHRVEIKRLRRDPLVQQRLHQP